MRAAVAWVEDRQYRLLTGLLVVAAVFMAQLPDGLSWASVGRPDSFSGAGTVLARLQWFPLFGLAAWVLVSRFRLAMAMLPHLNPFLVLSMLWLLASCLWSYDPNLSLRRTIKMLGTVLICWSVVLASWDYGRFERLLRWTLLAFLLGSLLFMLVRPTLGIHQADETEPLLAGCWRGLATHKNSFGLVASFSLVFWLQTWLTGARRGLALWAMAISLICVLGARSSTSLLCGLLASSLMVTALRTRLMHRPGGLLLFAGALLLVPFLVLVIVNGFPSIEQALGPLTRLLGRDLSFTGRVPLWDALLDEIPQRPLLGAGFQAFWGPPGSLSDVARAKAGWISANGHNGYLDTVNELGLIGLALILAAIAFDLRRARQLSALSASLFGLQLAVHAYQLIANLSETMFWRAISMTFLLTTLASFHLARIQLDLDLRRRTGAPLPVSAPPSEVSRHAYS